MALAPRGPREGEGWGGGRISALSLTPTRLASLADLPLSGGGEPAAPSHATIPGSGVRGASRATNNLVASCSATTAGATSRTRALRRAQP